MWDSEVLRLGGRGEIRILEPRNTKERSLFVYWKTNITGKTAALQSPGIQWNTAWKYLQQDNCGCSCPTAHTFHRTLWFYNVWLWFPKHNRCWFNDRVALCWDFQPHVTSAWGDSPSYMCMNIAKTWLYALCGRLSFKTLVKRETFSWIMDIRPELLLQTKNYPAQVLGANCRYMQTSFQNKTKQIILINPARRILRLNKLLHTRSDQSCVVVGNDVGFLQSIYPDF